MGILDKLFGKKTNPNDTRITSTSNIEYLNTITNSDDYMEIAQAFLNLIIWNCETNEEDWEAKQKFTTDLYKKGDIAMNRYFIDVLKSKLDNILKIENSEEKISSLKEFKTDMLYKAELSMKWELQAKHFDLSAKHWDEEWEKYGIGEEWLKQEFDMTLTFRAEHRASLNEYEKIIDEELSKGEINERY